MATKYNYQKWDSYKKANRKFSSTVAVIVITLIIVAAAYGYWYFFWLSGTYSTGGVLPQTVTFGRNNSIALSTWLTDNRGTYVRDGDKLTVTTTGILGRESTVTYIFSKRGNTIMLDGTRYIRI